ncbi:D-amino acid oxidase [Undibacterium sp. KW1]|uniref:NAD(P)/FAD-dependent oxidoreductase n=1 Tax=Undibacterium sp. KW1 TaxID=2058624 RepID=UPI001331DC6C|nr:FAD-dependent oxidoreductase [Undibacterium sp. KW1]BBB60608.1 D-amino acid oxidase [Undibacterium sp. KW1]
MKTTVCVIGAGIVGTSCALKMQEEGYQVNLIDAASPGCGVTAIGMGHLVALDESEQELDLCLLSLRMWKDFFTEFPGIGEVSQCGTLWVAENEDQLSEAHHRAQAMNARLWRAETLTGEQVQKLEPALRPGLAGGVRVFGDSVVYPPKLAHFMAQLLVKRGGNLILGKRVAQLTANQLVFADGSKLDADIIIVAAGLEVAKLLPEIAVFGRKGHLAITDRYPGRLSHQIVSMNYGQAAVSADALAVAANVQPRSNGQWLIGSCRQDGQTDNSLDSKALGAVLQSAMTLLPCLADMQIIRAWAGMRPASPDGHPIIGPHPGLAGVWLAAGHEGLGVTMAMATAKMLADQIAGRAGEIDYQHYSPERFFPVQELKYA